MRKVEGNVKGKEEDGSTKRTWVFAKSRGTMEILSTQIDVAGNLGGGKYAI